MHVDLLELLQHIGLDLETLDRIIQNLQLLWLEQSENWVIVHECCDDLSRSVLAVIANGASYSYAFLKHDHRVPVTLALCYPILIVSVIDGPVFDALVIVAIDIEIAVEILLPFHSLSSAVAAATVVGLEEVPVVVVF